MKIQIVAHADGRSSKNPIFRWHFLPYVFEKKRCKIDFILKKDTKYFYSRYLKFKPDVVLSAGFAGGVVTTFFKKLGLIKKPLIHDWNDDYVYVMGKKYGNFLVGFFEKFIIKNSDFIVTPSRYNQKKALELNKPVKFIPHGVTKKIKAFAFKLKGKNKIIYAGEISRMKNVDRLIDSVKGMDCNLYLFGKIMDKELEQQIRCNVHYMGVVKKKYLPTYYKQADILALTMDNDCCVKMNEYIIMGKPIIAPKGRISNVLKHKETAYITSDLRRGITILLKDKKLRKKLQDNVKKLRIYSWDKVADMYLNHIKKILSTYNTTVNKK